MSKLSTKVLSLFHLTHLFLLTQSAGNTTAGGDTFQVNAGIASDWGAFLASLNKSLDPLDLELSRIRNEVTGKEMYALVRCVPPTTTQPPRMFVLNVEYDF